MFEHFKEMFGKLLSAIIINQMDSEETKAKKIIWYSCIGAVIILIIVSWFILLISTFSNEKIKVPMLAGDDIYAALTKLSEKKLSSHVIAKYSDIIEPYKVIKSDPIQGSIVKSKRLITIYVSLGARDVSLPDFTGYNLFELDDFLNKNYPNGIPFKIDSITYEYDNVMEKGKIIKQEPKDGVPLHQVKKIKLWISNGIQDKETRLIENYVGKKVMEVTEKLSNMEIYFNYDFQIIKEKEKDMIIIDQSIGEGKPVDEIIEEGKILTLKVNKYEEIDGEKIKGTYLIDLPKKPIPYLLIVKIKNESNNKEKNILKIKTKGGVSMPVLYSAKNNSTISVYIDDKLYKQELIQITDKN